ncbi:MAG: XRE family transcriptional regulator [Clostridia bacterium]|nr:XRE family transcriptional regulator [Clostridia bacterium]
MLDVVGIGKRIRALRKAKGITQRRFAEDMSVSFQAVSNWERGVAPPELENLMRIASYFGVLIDELLRTDGETLFLGVDGGGTKTEFLVTTARGRAVAHARKAGCNPNDVGFEQMLATLTEGIRELSVTCPSIRYAFLGIAGITVGDHLPKLKAALGKQFPQLKCKVQSDASNLFAMNEEADMTLISGTGSVVLVRQGEGYARLGGWGYLLDQAGSAYDMGREAIRVALDEEDRGVSHSVLGALLLERLGTATAWQSLGAIYGGGKPFIASLADVVFRAYEAGDPRAEAIVEESAQALGKLLNLGVSRYGVKPVAIASGGVFGHHGDVMLSHVKKHTRVTVEMGTLPPVYGACRMACAMTGESPTEAFYENFEKTYGEVAK